MTTTDKRKVDAERKAAFKRLDWSGRTTRHVSLDDPDLVYLPDGGYTARDPRTTVSIRGDEISVETRYMLERTG